MERQLDLKEWKRRKDFLICIDSDGCAMNTMDIKHIRCFGPCLVKEWGLEEWEDAILNRWNEINLYTMTRGINRFLGLAMTLKEIDQRYVTIDGLEALEAFTKQSEELSNRALEQWISTVGGTCLSKALSWSNKVNAAIDDLHEEDKRPFDGVLEGLAAAHEFADVAVVSSANKKAVVEEWERWHLLRNVDVLCCQEAGSKVHCIRGLMQQGYASDHILMVGDAPGDAEAAARNGVYFYPVLVKGERESWVEFCDIALKKLLNGEFETYQAEVKRRFLSNLGDALAGSAEEGR